MPQGEKLWWGSHPLRTVFAAAMLDCVAAVAAAVVVLVVVLSVFVVVAVAAAFAAVGPVVVIAAGHYHCHWMALLCFFSNLECSVVEDLEGEPPQDPLRNQDAAMPLVAAVGRPKYFLSLALWGHG